MNSADLSRRAAVVLALALPCGGCRRSVPAVAPAAAAPAPVPAEARPLGALSGDFRVDNFGWRPADRKVAVLVGRPGASVELRRAADGAVAAVYAASDARTDAAASGDEYATVDFSSFSVPGAYYLYLATAGLRSYPFTIADGVYDIVGAAAVKSYYFQRCNHDKVLPYASDALGGRPGKGGRWVDGACHLGDAKTPPGKGSADDGVLDLRGGWHDAGDYEKTLWGDGVPALLFAYEVNPGAWKDGQLDIPESGNGVPDILDEARWELDFYARMQRPDGHFLSSVKGTPVSRDSPPSGSDERRVYFDGTFTVNEDGTGGGVTTAAATGNAVLALAHAAVVFRAAGQAAAADRYAAAAARGWGWLSRRALAGDEGRLKAAAAAAVFRMDPADASAERQAGAFAWDTWGGLIPSGAATPGESVVSAGAWHYLMNPAGDAAVKARIRTAVAAALVEPAFGVEGPYGGMFGGPENGWDWSWGSNREQSYCGFNLLMAAKLDALGARTVEEVSARAQKHLHYMLGLNPLNMVYLTNMAAYGGGHSSFHLYHLWFSYTGADGDHGNAAYNGKPAWVDEPLYPYHPEDAQTSTFGPAPGLIPGGPNWSYSGAYEIAKRRWPAYAYRDFSVGCGWDDAANKCQAASYELTEPQLAYQGPFVGMISFFMSGR